MDGDDDGIRYQPLFDTAAVGTAQTTAYISAGHITCTAVGARHARLLCPQKNTAVKKELQDEDGVISLVISVSRSEAPPLIFLPFHIFVPRSKVQT